MLSDTGIFRIKPNEYFEHTKVIVWIRVETTVYVALLEENENIHAAIWILHLFDHTLRHNPDANPNHAEPQEVECHDNTKYITRTDDCSDDCS